MDTVTLYWLMVACLSAITVVSLLVAREYPESGGRFRFVALLNAMTAVFFIMNSETVRFYIEAWMY